MVLSNRKTLHVVGVYVWHGKAYVPVENLYESGLYVDYDPVYVALLNKEELANVVQTVKDTGHKIIPTPKSREEILARKDPVLAATHARSWKQLAKTGAAYTIGWTIDHIRIDMSRLDKKGRWENDPEKVRMLPPDTPIEQIIEIILEDVNTRPEVFQ